MGHWRAGNFEAILEEDRAIQSRLTRCENRREDDNDARRFFDMMIKGRLREAMRLLSGERGRGLPLDNDADENTMVRDALRDKHPDAEPLKRLPDQPCTQMAARAHQVWMLMHGDAFVDLSRRHQQTSVKHW